VFTVPLSTNCCIVGGGPAGIMLGYLLARRGVEVTVLEKHPDFNRDFRGDTVHPSTLDVLHELGLLDRFLKIPHQTVEAVSGVYGDYPFQAADFTRVPARCRYAVLMPQWDLLNFLSDEASCYPNFKLLMRHEAINVIRPDSRVTGVVVRGPNQTDFELNATLVVGCDGRHSATRTATGLELIETGVPIDVLWFRISRRPSDPEDVLGNVNYGRVLILINRGDYFQAGLVIAKGSYPDIRERGLDEFRQTISRIAPYLAGCVDELREWNQIKILTVQINRLREWWRPGLLCIGDAAHAMSPVGGVGINLAIQDAVAAANLLAVPLLQGRVTPRLLAAVQASREFPARVTQAVQARAHGLLEKVFRQPGPAQAPWQLKLAVRIPGIHRALGHVLGIGVRPEHVEKSGIPRSVRRLSLFSAAAGAAIGFGAAFALIRRRRAAASERRRGGALEHPRHSPAAALAHEQIQAADRRSAYGMIIPI